MDEVTKEQLDCLFNPESIAVIGASERHNKLDYWAANWGTFLLQQILATSYPREIYAVNRDTSAVQNAKCYGSILDIPQPVDLAVMAIPAHATLAAASECVEKKVKNIVIVTAGFTELNTEGAKIEEELSRMARQANVRILGPNCMGYFNTHADLTTTVIPPVKQGTIGVISQSGNVGTSIIREGSKIGLGFSKYISTGNEADLHLEDFLEYLANDEKTRVIIAYIEGLREGRRFMKLAKETTKRKPIIALKAGLTRAGSRAARSHSAAMTGTGEIYQAAFKQCGIIQAQSIDEVIDTASALAHQPLPKGRRVAIVTIGGGLGVITADACEQLNLEVAPLSPQTMERLNNLLPRLWSHGNPVDTIGTVSTAFPCLSAILEDNNIDAVLTINTPIYGVHIIGNPNSKAAKTVENKNKESAELTTKLSQKYQKPILVSSSGLTTEQATQEVIHIYSSVNRATKTLNHLAEYSEYLSQVKGEKN